MLTTLPVPARFASAYDFSLRLQFSHLGLVHAERFFVQKVAGGGISAGTAAHTDVAKLAAATLACQVVSLAQLAKDFGVLPDFGEALLAEVPRNHAQVSAGINFALMRNEAHTGASQTTLGHGVHVVGMAGGMTGRRLSALRLQQDSGRTRHHHVAWADLSLRDCCLYSCRSLNWAALRNSALANHAEVMGCAGSFQLDAAFQRLVIKPVQHLFVFFRRDHLFGGNIHTAAYGHEQERVQRIGSQGLG